MSQPSPKRRRVSLEQMVENEVLQARSVPSTPRRASYRSPTKASLQRSHPHLLQRHQYSPGNQPAQSLLDRVLSLPEPQDKATGSQEGLAESNADENQVLEDATERPQPTADATVRERAPLRTRQPSTRTSVQHALEDDDGVFPLTPQLVKSSHSRRRELSLSPDHGEHSLPPSPVQLGLVPPLSPPRGLSSSSPRGSRSGSGRSRLRMRERRSVTSSPLKPRSRNVAPPAMTQEPSDVVEEAPESEAVLVDDTPEEIRVRQETLQNLQAQTRQLLANAKRLEFAVDKDSVFPAIDDDPAFVDLIKGAGMARTVQDNLFDLAPAKVPSEKELLHLNLFSPDLLLDTKARTKIVDGSTKVLHTISLSAPAPWLPHTLNTEFQVVTDPETLRVNTIKLLDTTRPDGMSHELHTWIKSRLANPNTRTDLAGLTWGIGNYFASAIRRAKIFHDLSTRYAHNGLEAPHLEQPLFDTFRSTKQIHLSHNEALTLTPYLTTTQLELHIPTTATDPIPALTAKVLAIYRIHLRPDSSTHDVWDIVTSGVPATAQRAARGLFRKLCRKQGFERAFDTVWELLGRHDGSEEDAMGEAVAGALRGDGKGRRKRKRVT